MIYKSHTQPSLHTVSTVHWSVTTADVWQRLNVH